MVPGWAPCGIAVHACSDAEGVSDSAELVSVVTPVGRRELNYLSELAENLGVLSGVLGAGVDWVVALDGDAVSVRETVQVCESSGGQVQVTVVPAPAAQCSGPGSARNRALEVVRGGCLLTVDSDDTVVPEGVEELLGVLRDRPDVSWAAGRAVDVDPSGAFLSAGPDDAYSPGVVPQGFVFAHRAAFGCPPFHPSATLVRTEAVRRVGGWPEGWFRSEDSALWSVLDAKFPGVWVPVRVLNYRKHDLSITASSWYQEPTPELLPKMARLVWEGRTN